uniref:Reverse transcriptase domain-containing protein n=1 Tax=Cannabis sativa TaxID=3483 RepID=A0A803Q1H3_CANSA
MGSDLVVPTLDQDHVPVSSATPNAPASLNMAFSTHPHSLIMVTSVITHTDKGKGIAQPDDACPPTPTVPRLLTKGITIQELTIAATATTTTAGVKRPFTRQHAQVGSSDRSMLKHARATQGFYGSDHRSIKTILEEDIRAQREDEASISNIFIGVSNHLSPSQSSNLASPFTADEIKNALFTISGDKAPGSVGLNAHFYQKNWNVLGKDLCTALFNVFNNHSDLSTINGTTLVLIPQKKIRDFRSISLCSTLYKIISKVLTNRLKTILHSIISSNQSVFLSDMLIFDNIFIANELINAIHYMKKGKHGWAALKLDIEKALSRPLSFVFVSLAILFLLS